MQCISFQKGEKAPLYDQPLFHISWQLAISRTQIYLRDDLHDGRTETVINFLKTTILKVSSVAFVCRNLSYTRLQVSCAVPAKLFNSQLRVVGICKFTPLSSD